MACTNVADETTEIVSAVGRTENGITIKESDDKKVAGKHNPKLSVFREFVLATIHFLAEGHAAKQSRALDSEDAPTAKRQFFACDLIAQSGIAGLQWKRRLGEKIHVTSVEQRDTQPLKENIRANGFAISPLPLDPARPAGNLLPRQNGSELHLAQCDPRVLLQLESFDFVYVDPHKNPAPYFGTVFRNMRKGGVVCFVVPDTMHFARSPHVVRRSFGAHCMKTEYLKELAVRIILATLAKEAAKCNKGLTVLYTVSLEDFLLLGVRVAPGPRLADDMLRESIGEVLHCRICEERTFYPATMAPVDDPYSLITCDCHKNVPGKTGVILGPLWKGSIFDYPTLTSLASSGHALNLSPSFFSLLRRVMEDCLCDDPPSLDSLQKGLAHRDSDHLPRSSNGEVSSETQETERTSEETEKENGNACIERKEDVRTRGDCEENMDCFSSAGAESADIQGSEPQSLGGDPKPDLEARLDEPRGVKRKAAILETDAEALTFVGKRLKGENQPAPCFFYNLHSKRLGTNHLPKHHTIIQLLRAHGYRSCRTHFERYAIRTSADLKTLSAILGTSENKVLYVKGSQQKA